MQFIMYVEGIPEIMRIKYCDEDNLSFVCLSVLDMLLYFLPRKCTFSFLRYVSILGVMESFLYTRLLYIKIYLQCCVDDI